MCIVQNLDEFRTAVESFTVANWPGVYPESVTISFPDGRPAFVLPHPSHPGRERKTTQRQTCSVDGTTVNWYGTRYTFRGIQSRVVRLLWDAWEQGVPDIRQDYLLVEAGSESRRLVDVFKKSDAWGVVIVPGEQGGTFRIADGPTE